MLYLGKAEMYSDCNVISCFQVMKTNWKIRNTGVYALDAWLTKYVVAKPKEKREIKQSIVIQLFYLQAEGSSQKEVADPKIKSEVAESEATISPTSENGSYQTENEDEDASAKGESCETEVLNNEDKSLTEATFFVGDDTKNEEEEEIEEVEEEEAQRDVRPNSQGEEGGSVFTENPLAGFDGIVEGGAKSEGFHLTDVKGNDLTGLEREEIIGIKDQLDPIEQGEITNGYVSQANDEENDDANASAVISEGSHPLQEKEYESLGPRTKEIASSKNQLIQNEPSKLTNESEGKGEDFVEHVNSSKKSVIGREDVTELKQANGEVQAEGCEANIEGLQVSYHGSGSQLKFGHSHSSVELGRMASTEGESNGEKSPERRRIGARFRNISVGNRVPKMNIFATAQARGRTLIPELRNKLSSFSQQVRSRSPRLNPKPRQSSDSESNSNKKQTRKKCRTRIIELWCQA